MVHYYSTDSQAKGPNSFHEIKALILRGEINRDTYLFAPEIGQWLLLADYLNAVADHEPDMRMPNGQDVRDFLAVSGHNLATDPLPASSAAGPAHVSSLREGSKEERSGGSQVALYVVWSIMAVAALLGTWEAVVTKAVPGAAGFEAADQYLTEHDTGGSGNTEAAAQMAEQFSEVAQALREEHFTAAEGLRAFMDRTFVTWCEHYPGRAAFLVKIPELGSFADAETQEHLLDVIWIAANQVAAQSGLLEPGDEMVVGLRGFVTYEFGVAGHVGQPPLQKDTFVFRTSNLYPFFSDADGPALNPETWESQNSFVFLTGCLSLLAMLVSVGAIFRKAGWSGWEVLVPFFNLYVLLKVAHMRGYHLFLLLIPLVNIIIAIMAIWRLARAFGHGIGLFLLNLLFAPFVLAYLGFGPSQYEQANTD